MLQVAANQLGVTGILLFISQQIQLIHQIIHITQLLRRMTATNQLQCQNPLGHGKFSWCIKTKATQISVPNILVLVVLIIYPVMVWIGLYVDIFPQMRILSGYYVLVLILIMYAHNTTKLYGYAHVKMEDLKPKAKLVSMALNVCHKFVILV